MSVWAKTWAYEQHPLKVDSEGNPIPSTKNPGAKAVLVALAEYPGPGERTCYPSQETLAKMTDYSERAVRGHLAALEAQGLISRTARYRDEGFKRRSDIITLEGPKTAFGAIPEESAAFIPEESAGETSVKKNTTNVVQKGNVAHLDGEVPQAVEALVGIKTWDIDEPATIALVLDAKKTYPTKDVVDVARTLAFKIRTKACKDYKKPSRAFPNWLARAEDKKNGGTSRIKSRRV